MRAGDALRHAGANAVNGTGRGREPDTSGGVPEERTPAHTGSGGPAPRPDDELGNGIDDTGPWNELDREIARALAATLAGKLSRYVTGPILPLVADELARLLGTRAVDEALPAEGAEARPRHLGDSTHPDRGSL